MAGYSGTPLPRKLGLKPGALFVLDRAPEAFAAGWPESYGLLPEAVEVSAKLPRHRAADIVLSFQTEKAVLSRRFPSLAAAIKADGAVWIAWPKRSAKVATDVTEDVVREIALAARLVDVKVCAIDDTWSGLKIVYRSADRAKLK